MTYVFNFGPAPVPVALAPALPSGGRDPTDKVEPLQDPDLRCFICYELAVAAVRIVKCACATAAEHNARRASGQCRACGCELACDAACLAQWFATQVCVAYARTHVYVCVCVQDRATGKQLAEQVGLPVLQG